MHQHLKPCAADCAMCDGAACAICGTPRPRSCQHSISVRHMVHVAEVADTPASPEAGEPNDVY